MKAVFFEVVWNWQTCFVSFSFLLLFFFFAWEIQLHIFLLDYCIWKPLSLTLSGYFHMGDILCLFWWLHISTIALSQQYRKHFEKLIAHRYIVFFYYMNILTSLFTPWQNPTMVGMCQIAGWWFDNDDDYDYDDLYIMVKVFSFCFSEYTASGNLCTWEQNCNFLFDFMMTMMLMMMKTMRHWHWKFRW